MTTGTQHVIKSIHQCFKDASDKLWDRKPADYCEIGSSRCLKCGWTGDYPVSGCPKCHHSFVC